VSDYVLGISRRHWSYIEAVSATLLIMNGTKAAVNTVGANGIFGYGKSTKLAGFGRNRNDTWKSLQALSLAVVAVTMLKGASESLKSAAINAQVSEIEEYAF